MAEIIINSNKYSRIVSPKIITKIDNSEKNRIIKATKDKLLEMHRLLLESSSNTIEFDIYSSSRAFNYDKCSDFVFFISDSEAGINFRYCIVDRFFDREYKKFSITLATFHNGDNFISLHYDSQLFSDFLELYQQIEEKFHMKLNSGQRFKNEYLESVKRIRELIGLSNPVKVAIEDSSIDEISIDNQSSDNKEEDKKVSNITINGRTIKIITADDITIVKPKKRKEKQKRLGGAD